MRTKLIAVGCAVAAVSALSLAAPPPVVAQAVICGPPANCTFVTGGGRDLKLCTEQWSYTVVSYTVAMAAATGAATNCTVTGDNQVRTFAARRPTDAPPTGACNFSGIFDFGGGTNTWLCTIDETGGLPVELMEFEVEDGEAAEES